MEDYYYSQAGWYFITICTRGKTCLLGEVESGRMTLSEIGRTAEEHLTKMPSYFPLICIDEHVIMPNHIHAIIAIKPVGAAFMPPAETLLSTGTESTPRSLSFIVQQYKSGVTRWCSINRLRYFGWQRGFYEHVIRNEDVLRDIRQYIINNPMRWGEDEVFRE